MKDEDKFQDSNEYEVCSVCKKTKIWSELYFLEQDNVFICLDCCDAMVEEDPMFDSCGCGGAIFVLPDTKCEDCGIPCEDGIGYECDHGIICEACYEEFFMDCGRTAYSAVGEVEELGGFTSDSFFKGGKYNYIKPKPHCNFCNTTVEEGELAVLEILGRKIEGVCLSCASGFTHL